MKIQARARVQITVEITLSQPWDSTCQLDQLYEQAKTSSLNIVRKVTLPSGEGPIIIIGDPKVIGVLTEEK